jgi:CBS domain-containing protein
MTIGRICQREVDFADPTESVFQAAERMHQRTVGALVILDAKRQPVGIVTDRDLATRAIAGCRDPFTTTVAEVMTCNPKTVVEETAIETALSLMRSGAFRRLPVVDRDNRLVGLVTLDDVLMLLCEEFATIGALLKRETPVAAALEWVSAKERGRQSISEPVGIVSRTEPCILSNFSPIRVSGLR